MYHRYGATNKPGTCLWCGRKLRQKYNTTFVRTEEKPRHCNVKVGDHIYGPSTTCKAPIDDKSAPWHCTAGHSVSSPRKIAERTKRYEKPGDYGDGHFCGLNCGYSFGKAIADNGRRLVPATKK